MTANSKTTKSTSKTGAARRLTGIAMLSAVAFALQFLEFPIPIMPAFIKLDFSDLPELLAAFAYGPLAGVAVAGIKNLIHLPLSSSMYVGELSNFLLGAVLSVAAGAIYKKHKTKRGALAAAVLSAVIMGLVSVPVNYWIIYPLYYNVLGFPQAAVLDMYQAILPATKSILQALFIFNLPFTVAKGLLCAALALVLWPGEAMGAMRDGLKLCGNVIIPSLFPFFVLSSLVVELGMSRYLGRLLEGVMAPLFRVGGACSSALALGFVGGYPVGARTAIALYENGQCSKTEAERLLAFCNNSGPAFILGVVGTGIFASSRAGLLLYLAHIAASLCVGLLFRFYRPGEGPRPGRHAAPQF